MSVRRVRPNQDAKWPEGRKAKMQGQRGENMTKQKKERMEASQAGPQKEKLFQRKGR